MCGRYFWDNDAEEAFEEDFPELAGMARLQEKVLRTADYTPAMEAAAVVGAAGTLAADILKWGFIGFDVFCRQRGFMSGTRRKKK